MYKKYKVPYVRKEAILMKRTFFLTLSIIALLFIITAVSNLAFAGDRGARNASPRGRSFIHVNPGRNPNSGTTVRSFDRSIKSRTRGNSIVHPGSITVDKNISPAPAGRAVPYSSRRNIPETRSTSYPSSPRSSRNFVDDGWTNESRHERRTPSSVYPTTSRNRDSYNQGRVDRGRKKPEPKSPAHKRDRNYRDSDVFDF